MDEKGGPPPAYPGGAAPYPPAPGQPGSAYPPAPGQPGSGYSSQPGAYGQPQQPYPATATRTVVVQQQPATVVLQGGNCPFCGQGVLVEEFTICGIIMAILFFPIGLLCCLLMKQRRCSNCAAVM